MALLSKEWFTLENVHIAAPLLAVAAAVIFDAGYFLAAGLDFFVLFSLSEHILLAVRGILTALGYVVIAGIIQASVFWDIEHRYALKWWQKYLPQLLIGAPLVALAAAWWWQILPAAVLFALVGLLTPSLYAANTYCQRPPRSLLIPVLLANLVFMYSLGFAVAHCGRSVTGFFHYVHLDQCLSFAKNPHSIAVDGVSPPTKGRLLASGQLGVLFGSGDAVHFWRWDRVREISSGGDPLYVMPPNPPTHQ
jgi:hypothetical protein